MSEDIFVCNNCNDVYDKVFSDTSSHTSNSESEHTSESEQEDNIDWITKCQQLEQKLLDLTIKHKKIKELNCKLSTKHNKLSINYDNLSTKYNNLKNKTIKVFENVTSRQQLASETINKYATLDSFNKYDTMSNLFFNAKSLKF